MASSPSSSSYSAYPTPFSSSWKFPDLPVAALRDKIVEKIQENRVTLIVGETGCGDLFYSLLSKLCMSSLVVSIDGNGHAFSVTCHMLRFGTMLK